jgi:RNA polymerase sigma-70 factor (ECF subfamily)
MHKLRRPFPLKYKTHEKDGSFTVYFLLVFLPVCDIHISMLDETNLPNNQPNNQKEKEFLEAYKLYADSIYRHCYFRVYNKDLAEDLTQETFIKTWKYIAEGKEVKNIKAFLYRVAVNLIIDHSRKKTALVFDDVKEKEVSVRLYSMENSMIDSFEIKEIVKTLDDLDEKYRQVIVMRYINQLSPSEIADVLGISTNAVSVKINYAMKKLREIIKTKYHES